MFNSPCLHINWKVHAADLNYVNTETKQELSDLNFIVKGEGLLKVKGSHVHWKSGNISETVLDRDVATTDH